MKTLLTAMLCLLCGASFAATTKPNVLFILCDDLRPDAEGCDSSKSVRTPNIRGIRTDEWKFVRYPHGDGSPDKHMAELYNLKRDPIERHNLANVPNHAGIRRQLEQQLADVLAAEGLTPDKDKMPLDQGIKTELPDAKIR